MRCGAVFSHAELHLATHGGRVRRIIAGVTEALQTPRGGYALAWIATQGWAITPDWLQFICDVAAREHDGLEAVEARLGRKLDNARSVTVRDGVAIVPVTGPIFRYADFFADISGAVSVETLARDLGEAVSNPAVAAIILELNSPGGTVAGVNEFAAHISAAAERKRVIAHSSGVCTSAAYWIASAADEIVIDATATLGSIGIVLSLPDPAARSYKADIEFVSSQSPNKRPDITTEQGRSVVQAHVDAVAQVFIETVARNRDLKPEEVVERFARGGHLVGQQAVDAGMADRLGTLEQLIAELSGRATDNTSRYGANASKGKVSFMSKGFLSRFFDSLSDDERKEAVGVLGGTKADEGKPGATQPGAPHESAEIARLKAEIADRDRKDVEAREASLAADAKAFARDEIKAGRIVPAAEASVVAEYIEAVQDDQARPVAQGQLSRLDRLKARHQSGKSHVLTKDLIETPKPAGATFIAGGTEPDADLKADIADAEAYAKSVNRK